MKPHIPKKIAQGSRSQARKITVLFTDIVDSSKVFQSQGNVAGLNMLRTHQEMVSPIIKEFGGEVVKFLGDSVLAYFYSPVEALKAAIRIQRSLSAYNQGKKKDSQIHIRIGLHHGDGIIEDKDIFGDVVNMAAKLLGLIGGDELFITEDVFQQIKQVFPVKLEQVDSPGKDNPLSGLRAYKINWQEPVNLEPERKILLYARTVPGLGGQWLEKSWNRLTDRTASRWRGRMEAMRILPDGSMAVILPPQSSPLDLARDITGFIQKEMKGSGISFVPVQIVIDAGPFFKGGEVKLEDFQVDWDIIDPGDIYCSASAYQAVTGEKNVPEGLQRNQTHMKINLDRQKENDTSGVFLYRKALVQGEGPPCFYCGDKRHPAVNCPSKQLPENTNTLEKLGYLSLEEINRLFLNYLKGKNTSTESDNLSESSIAQAFYDLRRVFQLRQLLAIWNAPLNAGWNDIRKGRSKGQERGGLIWLGQDCIRVSQLEKAETLVKRALEKNPNDYKAHCLMGFLNVDREEPVQAKSCFEKALYNASGRSERIYSLFLLARIDELSGSKTSSRARIMNILKIDPYCFDALYQDMLLQIRDGNGGRVWERMKDLIQIDREYYIYALIDPELEDLGESLQPMLTGLYQEAKDGALEMLGRSKNELLTLEQALSAGDAELRDLQKLTQRIEKAAVSESYFGFLDMIHLGRNFHLSARRIVDKKRKGLLQCLNQANRRLEQGLEATDRFPYPGLIGSIRMRFKVLKAEVERNWGAIRSDDVNTIEKARSQFAGIDKELGQLEVSLKRIQVLGRYLSFFAGFCRKTIYFQTVNFLIALLIFPVIAHYFNFMLPDLKLTSQSIWYYQKGLMALGGLTALFLALFTTTRQLNRE